MTLSSGRWGMWIGLFISAAIHGGITLLLVTLTTMPSLGFRFKVPEAIEVGIVEEVANPASIPSEPAPQTNTPEAPGKPTPNKVGEGEQEKPAPEKSAPETPKNEAKSEVSEATQRRNAEKFQAELKSLLSPEGGLISLRINLKAMRESALNDDIAQLLGAIPDWQLVLRGSEVDPLRDLEQLLIASPNFQRANWIFAGRYEGGTTRIREATERINTAHGEATRWRNKGAVEVADWHSDDPTPRIVALLGDDHFVICRDKDLVPILSIALKRAQKSSDIKEGLLNMKADQGLDLEVEGLHHYIAGGVENIPMRFHAQALRQSEARVSVVAEGTFESAKSAESATAFWERMRDRYAQHPLLMFTGMSTPLMETKLNRRAAALHAKTTLTTMQVRTVLGQIASMIAPPPMPAQ